MSNISVCDIDDTVKEALKKFRFRKEQSSAALILKVDRNNLKICVEDTLEDISITDLQEILPSHQPRFVIYTLKMTHKDGRISFPMCFIYVIPIGCQTELQVMYAGSKLSLQKEANISRVYEIRELEELTEDWLNEKLCK